MSNPTPVEILLSQISAASLFMLGAKDIFKTGDCVLTFRIGRNENGVTHVRITYDPAFDAYEVELLKIRGVKPPVTIEEIYNVHANQLHEVLEHGTGLRTKL